MFKRLRFWLRHSTHVHMREERVAVLSDMIDLIDRFIEGKLAYDLEWDDFISWRHPNPNIEAFRDRIARLEPMAFSEKHDDRAMFRAKLVMERDHAAALCGLPAQSEKIHS